MKKFISLILVVVFLVASSTMILADDLDLNLVAEWKATPRTGVDDPGLTPEDPPERGNIWTRATEFEKFLMAVAGMFIFYELTRNRGSGSPGCNDDVQTYCPPVGFNK